MASHRRLDWLLPSWLEDVNAYDQSIDEDMTTVYYTIAVNVAILVACVLFFAYYRMKHPEMFCPKAKLAPEKTPPPIPNDTMFGWVWDIFNIDDDTVIAKGGYDVLFLIRFYRLSFKIFFFFAFYALGVLLPINGTSDSDTDDNSFEVWSMTNIRQGSLRCWFHLVGIYLLTAITIYFLEKEFVVYAKHRHMYLRQRHAHLRTVLVEGIPHQLRSPVTLAMYFETMYPGAVLSVRCGQDLLYLDRLVAQRLQAVTKLERCLYMNHLNHTRPTVQLPNMLEEVDAIRYYTYILDDLNDAVTKEQESAMRLAMNADRLSGQTAFEVIEGFLRVTEIGSVKRMLKEKTGNSNKWMKKLRKGSKGDASPGLSPHANHDDSVGSKVVDGRRRSYVNGRDSYNSDTLSMHGVRWQKDGERSTSGPIASAGVDDQEPLLYESNGYGSIKGQGLDDLGDMSPRVADSAGGLDGADEGSGGAGGSLDDSSVASRSPFGMYKLTWSEWVWAMWTAPTPDDCWRTLKEGRKGENHPPEDAEEMALISPPEERRMFLSKAFVTFKTFTAATTARQVVHMQLAGHMAVSEAPEPSDITWCNMYTTRTGTFWRRFFVEVAVLLLIIVWVAPVTLVSFVVSEDALRKYFPFIDAWCNASEWFESAVELLQPGALVAIMNLLPPILTALAILEGCISFSTNQFRSFDRYFTFQVINVFLVTTIAGSVIDCIKDIYYDPASAFYLLGGSLPKMGGFFTNYMIVKAFAGLGMEIMRFPAMFSAILKTLFTPNLTPRDRMMTPLWGGIRAMCNPGWFPFAKIYAQDMLLVVVCATYACVAPLTIVAGVCYFAGAAYVYKHQLLYVYEPSFETGGKWWPKMARCFVVALLFAQATMVGMMILKETFTEIYLLAFIIAATSVYYWHVASIYVPLAAQLPFDMATSMDLDQHKFPDDLAGAEGYIQPSLRAEPVHPDVEFPITKTEPIAV